MGRRHYLFAYDISDDRQRTQVFATLRDHGDHAQYSVFFCELSAMELVHLCGQLETMINHATDQIIVLDLGSTGNPLDRGMRCIGQPHQPSGRVLVI